MSIDIPASGQESLKELLEASPKFLEALSNALAKSNPRLQWSMLEGQLVAKLREFPEAKRKTIRGALRMLNGVMTASEDEAISTVVADVMASAHATGDDKLSAKNKNWPQVQSFLERVLSLEHVQMSSKALSLFSDNERHMHGARLLTDARPIYSRDPDEGPQGFVILHTLRLDFYENNKNQEWYISLDSDDLETLREIVDRAIRKEKSLQDFLKKTDVAVFSYREEPNGPA